MRRPTRSTRTDTLFPYTTLFPSLVARRVGDDELAPRGREEAIGDVDGDALFPLRAKPVDEQREIEAAILRPGRFALTLERGELVLEQQLAVVEQPADQGRLAIVHRAAGDEARQRLALVRRQIVLDGLTGRIGRRHIAKSGGHQK